MLFLVMTASLSANNIGSSVGVISVIGNAFPREFSRMTRLALQGILLMLLLFITGLLSYLIFCLWMEIRLSKINVECNGNDRK